MITDEDWTSLLTSIFEYNECTPFLGAGACIPFFPSGQQLAEKWAAEVSYPFHHKDLSEVAQFIAVNWGGKAAKFKMDKVLKECIQANALPDFNCTGSIHGVLADLPLKIYLTTNYDNLMESALSAKLRKPATDHCRWNPTLQKLHPRTDTFGPSVEGPLVYHIHGVMGIPETMVLTDDDYETFLLGFGLDDKLVPPSVRIAISQYPLLFVGYSLRDWSFRVLFQGGCQGIRAKFQNSGNHGPVVSIRGDQSIGGDGLHFKEIRATRPQDILGHRVGIRDDLTPESGRV